MDTIGLVAQITDIRIKIYGVLIQELQSCGIFGLAPSHGAILHHLFNNKIVTMKDLAKAVNRDKSTITTLVGKLITGGYVEKLACSDDLRSTLVRLTQKGEELRPEFMDITKKLVNRIWQGFDANEQENLILNLKKIRSNF